MKETKGQIEHSVSRFYLKGFRNAKTKKVHCYFKSDPLPYSKSTGVDGCASEEGFYTSFDRLGDTPLSVEKILCKFETAAKPRLDRLVEGGAISSEDRMTVSQFIAMQMERVELSRDRCREVWEECQEHARDPESLRVFVEKRINDYRKHYTPEQIERFLDERDKAGYGVDIPGFDIRLLFARLGEMAQRIAMMTWIVERAAKGKFFATSDNPAYVRNPGNPYQPGVLGISRSDLGAHLFFPLTSNSLLIGSWGGDPATLNYKKATRSRVDFVNMMTVLMAGDEVYCREKSSRIANLVSQYSGFCVRPLEGGVFPKNNVVS